MEQEFLELVQIVNEMQQRILSLEHTNQVLIRSNKQLIECMEEKQRELGDYQNNVFFEMNDPSRDEEEYWYPSIASIEETIDMILREGKSLARFGDGEFSVIAGRIRHSFQNRTDDMLRERLLEVLQSNEEHLMIGLADNYGSLECYNEQAQREIRRYLSPQVRREHLQLLDSGRLYYNAYVTRPYVMYRDNRTDAPRKRFDALKKIWENRDCIFVEGCYTGLGVGNDLFDNAGSIGRILGPAENAFSSYGQLLETCIKQGKGRLFLLALGPAATVLAYDLARAGCQAVDVGHVDLEYEWFLKGEGRRTVVSGKYNNEVGQDQQLVSIQNEVYRSQIIADFS